MKLCAEAKEVHGTITLAVTLKRLSRNYKKIVPSLDALVLFCRSNAHLLSTVSHLQLIWKSYILYYLVLTLGLLCKHSCNIPNCYKPCWTSFIRNCIADRDKHAYLSHCSKPKDICVCCYFLSAFHQYCTIAHLTKSFRVIKGFQFHARALTFSRHSEQMIKKLPQKRSDKSLTWWSFCTPSIYKIEWNSGAWKKVSATNCICTNLQAAEYDITSSRFCWTIYDFDQDFGRKVEV